MEGFGRISDPGMGLYPLRVTLALRAPGWGSHTVRDGIDAGGPPSSSPVRRSCRYIEGLLIRVWDLIVPGWRWVYKRRTRVYKR